MKHALLVVLVIILFSCSAPPESFVEHLNGYWEIDEVQLPNGTKRDYKFNDTIDYLFITDSLTGFRKKVKPNFSGSFVTSKDSESLRLIIENDSLHVYYTTPYSQWKETILFASKDQLKVINENKNVYLYKRYQPLDLN